MSDLEKKADGIIQISKILPKTTPEIDKALSTTVRAVNAALVTIKPMIWGLEQINIWLDKKLPEKLQNIPPENIITPPINIAGPIIEAMRFTDNDELREMYSNLLSSAMNKDTTNSVHPRFVEIIKNMTSEEARLLFFCNQNILVEFELFRFYHAKHITNKNNHIYDIYYKGKPLSTMYDYKNIQSLIIGLENLSYLGLFTQKVIVNSEYLTSDDLYKKLHHTIKNYQILLDESPGKQYFYKYVLFSKTNFGESFINSVIEG